MEIGDSAGTTGLVVLGLSMGFLMARRTEADQIVGSVITQLASSLNVMDLKVFHAPTRLTTPAIPL